MAKENFSLDDALKLALNVTDYVVIWTIIRFLSVLASLQ